MPNSSNNLNIFNVAEPRLRASRNSKRLGYHYQESKTDVHTKDRSNSRIKKDYKRDSEREFDKTIRFLTRIEQLRDEQIEEGSAISMNESEEAIFMPDPEAYSMPSDDFDFVLSPD